jgi:hypothetical protein
VTPFSAPFSFDILKNYASKLPQLNFLALQLIFAIFIIAYLKKVGETSLAAY